MGNVQSASSRAMDTTSLRGLGWLALLLVRLLLIHDRSMWAARRAAQKRGVFVARQVRAVDRSGLCREQV